MYVSVGSSVQSRLLAVFVIHSLTHSTTTDIAGLIIGRSLPTTRGTTTGVDLGTLQGAAKLEAFLEGKTYIAGGDKPTADDRVVFTAVNTIPAACLAVYPRISAWLTAVAAVPAQERAAW
jgi:hypothetical protein